jgi:DNA-binding transcriptional regulator LsrR (DeoR family)
MSTLHFDVVELYYEGMNSRQIANELDVPHYVVMGILESLNQDF